MKASEKAAVDNKSDPQKFRRDLFNIARTTLSSKVLSHWDEDYFAKDAVLRLKGSIDLEHIQIIKKVGGKLTDFYMKVKAVVFLMLFRFLNEQLLGFIQST